MLNYLNSVLVSRDVFHMGSYLSSCALVYTLILYRKRDVRKIGWFICTFYAKKTIITFLCHRVTCESYLNFSGKQQFTYYLYWQLFVEIVLNKFVFIVSSTKLLYWEMLWDLGFFLAGVSFEWFLRGFLHQSNKFSNNLRSVLHFSIDQYSSLLFASTYSLSDPCWNVG